MTDQKFEAELEELMAETEKDPLAFAEVAYQWGEGDLVNSSGPRVWQKEIMGHIRDHLNNPLTRFTPLKIAVTSGHGSGKSALVGMVSNWGLSTCTDAKIVVTANTHAQLLTKTMPEIGRWFRSSITSHWFEPTATSVHSIDPKHDRSWRLDALTWSENNTEAFAGLHNMGRRIILIFDEASAISDKIWEVAEGALTDMNTEIIWMTFGNPTRSSGRFRECWGKFKNRWFTKQLDTRTVEGVNLAQIQEWIDDYGIDSDFVKVRVLGLFPRAGTMQFIASDLVQTARTREANYTVYDPIVIGVDVARFGDDETVIVIRRGRDARTIPWIVLRQADNMKVANTVAELIDKYQPDATFIDGGGVGGGVIDILRSRKYTVGEVQFGASPDGDTMKEEGKVGYANKRAEIWGNLKEWLKGGMIPDEDELESQLVGVEYGYRMMEGKDVIQLESKKDMKKRGLFSPDRADALAISLAFPVQRVDHSAQMRNQHGAGSHQIGYDPLAISYISRDLGAQQSTHQSNYDSLSLDYLKKN